ncbi:hypothetical protein ALC57_18524, partial [Trachymyrmex cornetzi]
RLNFLDVTIMNMNGKLEFNLYHKLTFSGRYLSFSHPKYYSDNFKFIIKTFLDNDYPMNFIFDSIDLRLKSLLKRQTLKQTDKPNVDKKITS